MRAKANPAPTRNGKRRLLESCAIVAGLAALAYGGPALAQVAGTGQAVTGPGLSTPTISAPGPGPTIVNTTGDQTIINWTPSNAPVGGVIDFLPAGNSLNFTGNGQYIVLNRFVSGAGLPIADQIALNGTVNSVDFLASGARGGNIWFYNAGGILIGATGIIDVGSLVLTSNDIFTDDGLLGPAGEIRFRGAPGSTSNVTIAAGAAINAGNAFSPGSSYVALVAPRVVQAGAVRVDGSVGYVAAEQADITINGGLFDINVSVGAEGGNVITHTGTTGGPGHLDSNPNDSRIYMVAIPKNLAVTMLVSGQIGYDAVSAQVDPNGAVRLSAGHNITNGEINDTPVNATAANITVGDTLVSSSVVARASGTFAGQPDNMIPPSTPPTPQTGKIIVRGDADFGGDAGATLTAGTDQAIEVDGALTLRSLGQFQTDGSRQGSNATLSVLGGSVTAGSITVASIGAGGVGAGGDGGDGVGGDASVLISGTGSAVDTNGLTIQSTGIGGGVTYDSGGIATAVDNSGDGTGGNATLTVENGGALSVNGSLSVASTGVGQTGNVQSGSGTGGIARISVTGAGTSVDALNTSATADGVGGTAISQPSADVTTENGGAGSGGSAAIIINANNIASVDLGGVAMSANGIGGDSSEFEGATGGDGTGGTVSLSVDGGIAVDMNDLVLSAVARSGVAGSPSNLSATSGDSLGGTVTITVANGSGIINDGSTSINVSGLTGFGDNIGSGTGGDVVVSATTGGLFSTDGNVDINAAGGNVISSGTFNAGAATGGNVDLTADGGTITAGSYFVDAGAQRPSADNDGGAVDGGTIDLLATNNGTISATNSGSSNDFSAVASSGSAPNDVFATGGTIQVIADGGTIAMVGTTNFSATGVSGGNGTEGAAALESGIGGTALIRVRNSTTGTGSMTFDDVFLDAIGATQSFSEGVNAGNGATGAVGGTATFDMESGSFTANELNISADGLGGSVAGTGRGGNATFTQTGGTLTVNTLLVSASGRGGFDPAVSGMGIGGTATLNLLGGTLTGGNVSASANGRGGNGANGNDEDPANPTPTGTGGLGQGGAATINIDGTAVIDTTSLAAYANGQGGQGGSYFADAVPGNGGDAGDGTGGTATINITSGTLTTGDLIVDASSIGGEGGDILASSSSGSVAGLGVGGEGGSGLGGTATLDFATSFTASGTVTSVSTGSGGAGGFGSAGGSGGDGTGGLAQVIVSDFDAGALSLTVNASAIGGSGGFSDDGAGGNGGSATGGAGRIEADGANANIAVSQANFVTNATGGSGGGANSDFFSEEVVGGAGGSGGNGTGGTLEVVASNGATVAIGPDTSGVIALGSAGTGGSGGSGAFNAFGGMRVGGDGGAGGGGIGGTVRLSANGGTITSNGDAVDINVSGLSGLGGTGGSGSAGNGANGGSLGTTGGRAIIAAVGTSSGTSAIDLGTTTIAANGDAAGRIEVRTDGNISFTSLTAEALGTAPPTNNDTDEAPAGIFFAATGGTISTSGDMTLTTDSSFGTYGQSNGTVTVGGDLAIDAGDQIDIRHDFREGTAPTIAAAGNLTAIAGGVSGTPGSLLDAGGALSLTSTLGSIGVDQLDGNNIVIAAAGAASVEHAEAVNDFTATAASFRTGLNSIITGGDILITSPGAVDLGNSTAGGFVQVEGQSIVFNNIDAGFSVFLNATGDAPGAEGITGGSIDTGGSINLNATRIAINGEIAGDGALFANGSAGPVAIALANMGDFISISATGDITGTYNTPNNIRLTSGANIGASANATGFESSSSGTPIAASVYAEAEGDVALSDSSATGMFGVRAGGSASMNGANVGEDLLVLAGTTATLTDITVGDDLTVTAAGDIIADGLTTTGDGPDTVILGFVAGSGFTINSGEGVSTINGSDIILSAGGAIGASALSAGDDIFATAPGAIAINGATTLGLGITGGSSDIRTQGGDTTLAALNAFTDVLVTATGAFNATGTVAAGRNVTVTATSANLETLPSSGAAFVSTLEAGADLSLITSGDIVGGRVRAGGDLTLTGASIDITRAQTTGVGQLTLAGTNGVNATNIQAGGATLLNASNGAVTSDGLLSTGPVTATGDSINLRTGGDIVFAVLDADVDDVVVTNGSGTLTVTSGVAAGRATLTSENGNDIIISQLAANAADITSEGNIFVNGVLTARDIALQSNDIIIASGARVGTAGSTETLSIENNDVFSQTFVGGTGTRNGFHLDAAELTRLFGTDIEVFAPEVQAVNSTSVGSNSPPDIIVDSFTLAGGAPGSNLGANGALTIRTPGKMRVIGNVQLTGLTDANTLNLFAGDAFEVILGQGTVRLVNGSNAAGRLNMVSDDIIVATTAAINDVGAATTTNAIETRLAQNDGVVIDEGSLFARGIRAEIVGGFYVQNSGSGSEFANRRGLSFGAGGLDVLTEGSGSRIVINGVQLGASGQVTGLDTVPLLTIGGSAPTPGRFDPRSTFNGCLIANPAACGVLPPPEPEFESSFPVQDVIEEEADAEDEEGNGQSLPVPLITMRDLDPLSGEPLLDDPVTGAGNDDLWTPTEGP